METLKAPFPWFGGKRRVADLVWRALGGVDSYIEPFAGSMAVLLGRPSKPRTETVNDADAYLCNFWRALVADPEAVARHCDWPVNETDLGARHLWLVNAGRERIEALESDPDYFDAKVAGWWVWGINSWIGSGWCVGKGPWQLIDGKLAKNETGQGINRQLPHLGDAGQGINRQRPHLGDAGQGINRRDSERDIFAYFSLLSERLHKVRVCCGDWSRVVTNGAMSYGDRVGVFLDPPYLGDVRTKDLYRVEDHAISDEVRAWAIDNGEDRRLRIILCGYHEEHADKMPKSWRMHKYSASKAYGSTAAVGKKEGNDANRHNERIWFSPHCIKPERGLLER